MPKRTPLYELHLELGAKMTVFAGWELPVSYAGILAEHAATRERAGLFDVSHMGRLELRGPHAADVLQAVSTNDVSALQVGRAQYALMCREDGGIIEDFITLRLEPERFVPVVNAVNKDKDIAWLQQTAGDRLQVADLSGATAMIAIQGPRAEGILQNLVPADLSAVRRFGVMSVHLEEFGDTILSRTGYTGEDGFEIIVPADAAEELYRRLLELGESEGIAPCGLGARDVLRLEAGLPLYGHEHTEDTNPIEAGEAKFVKPDAGDFCGREALQRIAEAPLARRLVGLKMHGRRIPRQGAIVLKDDEEIGQVTSGTLSPVLKSPIALAYLRADVADVGTRVHVRIDERSELQEGEVVEHHFLANHRA
ncbi:MAG: glycine cleavage system aminomethyltransferase GcvT [Armatimonadota bacterium]